MEQAQPLRAAAAPFRLEGSVLYFAVATADGTVQAALRVPVEVSRFQAVPGPEGQVVLRYPVVLELAVPEAAEAAAGSWRFWDGTAR